MKKSVNKYIQWTFFSLLCLVGAIALFVLAGDEYPMNTMSLTRWFGIKAVAMGVVAICIWLGKFLNKRGYLPDCINKDEE